jgi:hypothetical protein
MIKATKMEPSDDFVRLNILKFLYNSWKNPRGMESHKLKISELCSGLKKQDIEKKYVIRNLLYLIETGWAIEEIKESKFQKGRMSYTNEKKTYRISKDGIDFFEGSSKFQKRNNLTGINMSNVQNSIIVLGDNNYVRQEYKELSEALTELGSLIRMSSKIPDDEKVDYQAEVETIKAQLGKRKPNKNILQKAWDGLQAVATIGGVSELFTQIYPLITDLLKKLF